MRALGTICCLLLLLEASGNQVVIAGGGTGGDVGDKTAWNFGLYSKLITNLSKQKRLGDNVLSVVVLTGFEDPTEYLPNYFGWLGTLAGYLTHSRNCRVRTRSEANNATLVGIVLTADVIFISGGDQGQYYHEWNNTLLHRHIFSALKKGASIGGTSAGAMILAEYSFSGGSDLVTPDVLEDAQTSNLDDIIDHKSAIHTDFLSIVKRAVVDTHVTERARLGRLVGILARAIEDSGNHGIVGIGLEQKTGLWIHDGIAEVMGIGTVNIIKELPDSYLRRDKRRPLVYTNLRFDRLTDGWRIKLDTMSPDYEHLPKTAIKVEYPGDGMVNKYDLSIRGDTTSDNEKFDYTIDFYPQDYAIRTTSRSVFVRNAFGMTRCYDDSNKASKDESLFRGMYDRPSYLGVFLFADANAYRTSRVPDVLEFASHLAGIVIDPKPATYKSLSPYPSTYAISGGKLQAAGLTNMLLHIIGESYDRSLYYNTRTRTLVKERP